MKIKILIALLFTAVTASASTFYVHLADWNVANTNAVTNQLIFQQISPTGLTVTGDAIAVGLPIKVNVTNGYSTNTFLAGNYSMIISNGANFPFNKPLIFTVPNDTNFYSLTNLLKTGGNVFVTTTQIINTNISGSGGTNSTVIAAGTGVTVTPSGNTNIIATDTNTIASRLYASGYTDAAVNTISNLQASAIAANAVSLLTKQTTNAALTALSSNNGGNLTNVNGFITNTFPVINLTTNSFIMQGAGYSVYNATYIWSGTAFTNISTHIGFYFDVPDGGYWTSISNNTPTDFTYYTTAQSGSTAFPYVWQSTFAGGNPPPSGYFPYATNALLQLIQPATLAPISFSNGVIATTYNTYGNTVVNDNPQFPNAIIGSLGSYCAGFDSAIIGGGRVTNMSGSSGTVAAGCNIFTIAANGGDNFFGAVENGYASNSQGVAFMLGTFNSTNLGDSYVGVMAATGSTLWNDPLHNGTFDSVIIATGGTQARGVELLVTGDSQNIHGYNLFVAGAKIYTTNCYTNAFIGTGLSSSNLSNSVIIGNGLTNNSTGNIVQLGITNSTLTVTSSNAAFSTNLTVAGVIAANGSGITALNGANISSGTISSNALDAATKAQLALAGGATVNTNLLVNTNDARSITLSSPNNLITASNLSTVGTVGNVSNSVSFYTNRVVTAGGIIKEVIPSRAAPMTNATASWLCNISLQTNAVLNGSILLGVRATNSTTVLCAVSGRNNFSAANSNGVVFSASGSYTGASSITTGGGVTISQALTVSNIANGIALYLNVNCSSSTATEDCTYQLTLNGSDPTTTVTTY